MKSASPVHIRGIVLVNIRSSRNRLNTVQGVCGSGSKRPWILKGIASSSLRVHGNYRRHIITCSNHRGTGIWLITRTSPSSSHSFIHSAMKFHPQSLNKCPMWCRHRQNGLRMVSSWGGGGRGEEYSVEDYTPATSYVEECARPRDQELVDEKNAHLFAHIDTLSSTTAKKEIPPRTPFAGINYKKVDRQQTTAGCPLITRIHIQ